jgi:DNA modification methylase
MKIWNWTAYLWDCLEVIRDIPDNIIDWIITSPPYNIATKRKDCYYNNWYSENDNLSEDDYLNIRTSEFKEFSRIIKDDWVICYNISYHNENPILPTLLVSKIHNETDLTIADIIAWKKRSAIPFQTSPTKLSRITELIYVFVKKYRLHNFKTNKEISKINKKTNQKFYKNYTNFIEAKNNDWIKTTNKATYSSELVEKIINIYFPIWNLILDPFAWIFTTAVACENTNRKWICIEKEKEYFDIWINRLNNLQSSLSYN